MSVTQHLDRLVKKPKLTCLRYITLACSDRLRVNHTLSHAVSGIRISKLLRLSQIIRRLNNVVCVFNKFDAFVF